MSSPTSVRSRVTYLAAPWLVWLSGFCGFLLLWVLPRSGFENALQYMLFKYAPPLMLMSLLAAVILTIFFAKAYNTNNALSYSRNVRAQCLAWLAAWVATFPLSDVTSPWVSPGIAGSITPAPGYELNPGYFLWNIPALLFFCLMSILITRMSYRNAGVAESSRAETKTADKQET